MHADRIVHLRHLGHFKLCMIDNGSLCCQMYGADNLNGPGEDCITFRIQLYPLEHALQVITRT